MYNQEAWLFVGGVIPAGNPALLHVFAQFQVIYKVADAYNGNVRFPQLSFIRWSQRIAE